VKKPNIEELKTLLFEIGKITQQQRITLEYGLKDEMKKLNTEFNEKITEWSQKYNIGICVAETMRYVEPEGNHFYFTPPHTHWRPRESGSPYYREKYNAELVVCCKIDFSRGHAEILPDGIKAIVTAIPEEYQEEDRGTEDETPPNPFNTLSDKDFLKSIGIKDNEEKKDDK